MTVLDTTLLRGISQWPAGRFNMDLGKVHFALGAVQYTLVDTTLCIMAVGQDYSRVLRRRPGAK